jgi:hypothetical protein
VWLKIIIYLRNDKKVIMLIFEKTKIEPFAAKHAIAKSALSQWRLARLTVLNGEGITI